MKECKVIRINDGLEDEIQNGEFMHILTQPRAEKLIEFFLDNGYEVKQMIRDFSPGMGGAGGYSFYRGGLIFYLEREVEDESEKMSDREILEAWKTIQADFQSMSDDRKRELEDDEDVEQEFIVDDTDDYDIDDDDYYYDDDDDENV